MPISREELSKMLYVERFPRSSRYDPFWIVKNQMGPSAVWLTEWLTDGMELKPGMKVLDMGCGRVLSSVFLAREYGVQVWANDLWIEPEENLAHIHDAGLQDRIFPIHAEAHALPYAAEFFDAIVSIDSYQYYGTSDLYLKYFSKFVKPGGLIGLAMPALMREIEGEVPEHLARRQKSGGVFWDPTECFSLHTLQWWKRHLDKTKLVDIEVADNLDEGCRLWLQWERALAAADALIFPSDEECLEADDGRYIGFVRVIARRR